MTTDKHLQAKPKGVGKVTQITVGPVRRVWSLAPYKTLEIGIGEIVVQVDDDDDPEQIMAYWIGKARWAIFNQARPILEEHRILKGKVLEMEAGAPIMNPADPAGVGEGAYERQNFTQTILPNSDYLEDEEALYL